MKCKLDNLVKSFIVMLNKKNALGTCILPCALQCLKGKHNSRLPAFLHHGSEEDQQGAEGHRQRPPGPVQRRTSG